MQPLRLLIADDSEVDTELLVTTLGRAGVDFQWTRVDDEAGLIRSLKDAPDAVICDHYMPLLTVPQVAATVAANDRDCPMIVVSGQLDDAAGAGLIGGACRDFVRKDALHRLPAALLREVDAAHQRRRLRDSHAVAQAATADPLEQALRVALAEDRLCFHLQPQVDLQSGRIIGFEALARWEDPLLGQVPPSRFVAAAEACDLALPLGNWALRTACRQLAEWGRAGHRETHLAVNLSGRHFVADGVFEQVNEAMAEFGVDPRRLQIEITENTLVGDTDRAVDTMRRLAALGVRFAVDDFGTGYSSLSYLSRFPIHEVKIDRSFVAKMTERTEDAVIVRTIIAMAHSLGAHVVAEGVETEAQLAALRTARCDIVQGYLVGRPAPAASCAALLAAPPAIAPSSQAGAQRTLLLVDDEPNIASSLKRLLRADGYRILIAASAAQGFELLATNDVGVIVSDQRMPVMTGTEFLSRVKNMHPLTMRMVLSGFTDLESITSAINEGAIFKFLTKPWEDDAIRATIKDAFERHELLRDREAVSEDARRYAKALAEANARLERQVADTGEAYARQMAVLRVAQDTLDRLPLAVVAVDAEGFVAAANEYAVIALGATLGERAADCLQAPLAELLLASFADGGEARGACDEHAVVCRPMDPTSGRGARILVAVPETL